MKILKSGILKLNNNIEQDLIHLPESNLFKYPTDVDRLQTVIKNIEILKNDTFLNFIASEDELFLQHTCQRCYIIEDNFIHPYLFKELEPELTNPVDANRFEASTFFFSNDVYDISLNPKSRLVVNPEILKDIVYQFSKQNDKSYVTLEDLEDPEGLITVNSKSLLILSKPCKNVGRERIKDVVKIVNNFPGAVLMNTSCLTLIRLTSADIFDDECAEFFKGF